MYSLATKHFVKDRGTDAETTACPEHDDNRRSY